MYPDTREHIFIVEDNEVYSMMLDYILTKDSVYKFSSFKSGEECIRNLYLNPRVIILDYQLPGINGYQTLLEIKKYNPAIHVLMLSNNENMKLVADLLKAGADDYILKQGHGEKQIIEKIETLLATDEMQEEAHSKISLKKLFKGLFYFLAIISMIIAGVVYYW
jgi:two-component system, NtrC family, response regulator AtoC